MYSTRNTIAIVIPSLNPEEFLLDYVHLLQNQGFLEIIVVNDGSTKGTEIFDKIQEEKLCRVITHEVNQGKGQALKTGFAYLLNQYNREELTGVVTADADGQHSLEDTIRVADKLAESHSFILGCRDFDQEMVPIKSKFGNKLTTWIFAVLYGKRISDTQTGLRGIPYSFLAECVAMKGQRFDYEIRMLIQGVTEGIGVEEVPIETIYYHGNRETHFRAVKDSLRIYRILFSQWFLFLGSSLISFVVDIVLFWLLIKFLPGRLPERERILVGTLGARIVSSFFNYFMNGNLVFKKVKPGAKRKTKESLVRYYLLCILQANLSWILVAWVVSGLSGSETFVKVVVDTLLFLISYQIQRRWVF